MATNKRKVIAVVDDDPLIRQAMKSLLASVGYCSELYSCSAEFAAAALITEASCLVLDVELGGAAGIDWARHLISVGLGLPIIFMTGSDDQSYRREGLALGCVDYLLKPISPGRFISAVEKALAQGADFTAPKR